MRMRKIGFLPVSGIFRAGKNKGLSAGTECWRAAFGYSVSAAWLVNMLALSYLAVSGRDGTAEIIMAMVETAPLWGVALGVLGISVVSGNASLPEKRRKTVRNKNHDKNERN